MDPVLKWAGGKRWALGALAELYAPYQDRRLVEPFVGGMSVALGLRPERALLADVNPHLINFYRRLCDKRPFAIAMANDERLYYAQRDVFNTLVALRGPNTAEAAEIFYYLNRTGFNGLCRFNRSGGFNVPFGKYAVINYRRDFSEYVSILRRWEIRLDSFDTTLERAHKGDFIYVDPPYDGTFTDYSEGGFDWDQQHRLAVKLAAHNGPVVASNAATDRVLALYRELGFSVATVGIKRSISANGDRAAAMEMLATKNIEKHVDTLKGVVA